MYTYIYEIHSFCSAYTHLQTNSYNNNHFFVYLYYKKKIMFMSVPPILILNLSLLSSVSPFLIWKYWPSFSSI